ncbi:hypothetical protein SAM40697_5347 [Streptomyces ambofaciens]|uniref:Protein-glutamine gamma-glutamyltransferase-like C-terminal domain-containing protein n=1 Tax=Streptomyces ambofaciens TaxID=1889 RepID=A0ABN4PD88_STRAM|nr:DUF4129 domain-containing protein [Streptomyces ambofaciens]ANB09303.1 hypothetical protein SAM40697_5347 [Streptomyces ambofaciens]
MDHGGRARQRAVPGAAVAAGAVGALTVAALALRPSEGLLHAGRGPLGHGGVVIVSSLVWSALVVRTVTRLRGRFGSRRAALPAGEQRLREAAAPLLLAGAGLIGVLALVLHRFPGGTESGPPPPPLPTRLPTPGPGGPTAPEGPGNAPSLPSLPLYAVLGLLAAAVVVIVAPAVVRRLRRRGLRVPQRPGPAGTVADGDEARLLLSAVRSGRLALSDTGDARADVIACYAAMEDALVVSGVRRHASDSPADLLARAAGAGLSPGPAAPRLTALFREARYSSHPMDRSHHEAAARALEEIASLLRDREGAR